jgi:hypothetical protein
MIRFKDIPQEYPFYYPEEEYAKRAKVKLVVTKIKCPACVGDGLDHGFPGTVCDSCHGEKWLDREQALEYASALWYLSNLDYMEGKFVLSLREMKSKANAIRQLLGEEKFNEVRSVWRPQGK